MTWASLTMTVMLLVAIFLILLVLVQRGRGGGLAGALGGMGGQSAFGTKAGDLFTRITMVVATIWILLCVAAIVMLNASSNLGDFGAGRPSVTDADLGGATTGEEGEATGGEAATDDGAAATDDGTEGDAGGAASEEAGDGTEASGAGESVDAEPATNLEDPTDADAQP